jgi:hypothetical protein
MQVQCAPDLASRSHSGSDFSHFRPKEEATDYYHVETKVCCLCSSTMLNEDMIKVSYPFIYCFLPFERHVLREIISLTTTRFI